MQVTIDPEFANLCPEMKPEERTGLEADLIAAKRARVPLDVWGDILLDGHNRFEICTRLGLPFDVAQVPGIETREQAHNWIISNQLNRRNLTPIEASYLRGKRYNAEKLTPAERNKRVAASKASRLENPNQERRGAEPAQTAKRLAEDLGVTPDLLVNDGAFAAALDSIAINVGPEVARDIRSGKADLTKTQVREIGKMEPEQQAVAIKQAKAKPKRPTAAKLGKITPMERNQISEAQKDAGKNFLHAIRILHGMKSEPEVLARMKWPDNWREAIDGHLADAATYLADFSAAWNSKGYGQ